MAESNGTTCTCIIFNRNLAAASVAVSAATESYGLPAVFAAVTRHPIFSDNPAY